jgi:hypothetical protein
VSGIARGRLKGFDQHLLNLFVTDLAWSTAAVLVEEPGQTSFDVAPAPLANGGVGDAKRGCDLGVGRALSAAKDDARPQRQRLRGLAPSGETLKRLQVLRGYDQVCFGTATLYAKSPRTEMDACLTILTPTYETGH